MAIELITSDPEATRRAGEQIGRLLQRGDVVLLDGDLGAGKTTLTQGIARGLGVDDYVQSPTFTIVNEYEGRTATGEPIRLYHIDLYRLAGGDDLASFGFDDLLRPVDGVSVVEWPERASDRLPERYLLVRLDGLGDDRRRLTLTVEPPDAAATSRLTDLGRAVVGSEGGGRRAEERVGNDRPV